MAGHSFPEQLSFIADLFSDTHLRHDFVTAVVGRLHEWTRCECVGIRIVNPDAYMPYEAYIGFSQEFWEHENWLSLREHQCGCIRIVNNETLPVDQPLLTENGSILTNDLQAFGETLTTEEAGLYRGKCIDCGFGSLALVPIRKQGVVIGLIHLADKRTQLLPLTTIQTLEALTTPIAEVIERFSAEERLIHQKVEMEQFVYSVSHDLKSPLITIRSFVELLRGDVQKGDQQKIRNSLDFIDKASARMEQLLEALLQYSRVSRSHSVSQTRPVGQVVDECLTALAGILTRSDVQVDVGDMPQSLYGDPLHFGRIWQNLIENAVKYMGGQPRPVIEVGVVDQMRDLVFYVRDNGMGIAPEQHQRIFGLFSQINPASEGTGLGLALVKKIISIYGGRIWVESAATDRGSCFYFTLPAAVGQQGVNRHDG